MIKKGFTLIELLIVVAIIGILAGIVLFTLNPTGAQNRAKNAVLASNLEKLSTAAKAAYVSNLTGVQAYPNEGTVAVDKTALTDTGLVDSGSWPKDYAATPLDIVYHANATAFCLSGAAAGGTGASAYLYMTASTATVQTGANPCATPTTY